MDEETTISISVPESLRAQLEGRVKKTGFNSVEEYIRFILEEVVREEKSDEEEDLSEEQEKKIEDNLKGLGYL